MIARAGLVVISIAVAGCRVPMETPQGPPGPFQEAPASAELRVLVIGDFGTGGPDQRAIAQTIGRIHAAAPPHLVLTVGDNFYPAGVTSTTDDLWETAFRSVYTGSFWDTVTFRPTLGNHDYAGDPLAQVAYSEVDSRWQMPDLFYSFRESTPDGGSVQFIALDTDIMDEERDLLGEPAWLDSVSSSARIDNTDWTIAFGHHPVVTAGRHSPSKQVVEYLRPAIEKHRFLYLAGHNHSTELLSIAPGLLQVVCGGAGGRDNDYLVFRQDNVKAAFSGGGWCLLRIWKETLVIELRDRYGTLRHREILRKPPGAG